MKRLALFTLAVAASLAGAWKAQSACCYFSAVGSDVNQPGQKAFLTYDPQEEIESFTVQPKFEGNAEDFGMVIPAPSRPKLLEMPRDFFKELAVFTILKPMPLDKYKLMPRITGGFGFGGFGGGGLGGALPRRSTVRVVEAGVVGSLEYKIVTAERADDLYQWLKENKYSYAGDEETLNAYVAKKWVFTVMRIDPKQMKRGADGKYLGEVTPTRFTFSSKALVYPLRITRLSVATQTEALFYVQAPYKVDLPGSFSYEYTWTPMLRQALGFAVPAKVTTAEKAWMKTADTASPELGQEEQRYRSQDPGWQPARLDWAKKITKQDIGMLDGSVKYDRQADPEAVKNLKLLRGHVREGQWVTKLRKVFRREEMTGDLQFIPAGLGLASDEMEYAEILPTSPP